MQMREETRKKSFLHGVEILSPLKLKARGTQLVKTKDLIKKRQQQNFIEI